MRIEHSRYISSINDEQTFLSTCDSDKCDKIRDIMNTDLNFFMR